MRTTFFQLKILFLLPLFLLNSFLQGTESSFSVGKIANDGFISEEPVDDDDEDPWWEQTYT